jgi:ABC-type molybdate transport system substrate-binding protein
MLKTIRRLLVTVAGVLFFTLSAHAADYSEIQSITVLADTRLSIPLSQLATRFTQSHNISVANAFGTSADQKKKIEDGEPADLFITSNAELIEQLKIKGLVDVNSITRITDSKSVRFTAAVVAGENMTPARKFLEYIKSPEAQPFFMKNGLAEP